MQMFFLLTLWISLLEMNLTENWNVSGQHITQMTKLAK